MKELKADERRKGAAALQAQLDKDAQDLGYANHAAMIQHLKSQRANPRASGRPQGQPGSGGTQPTPSHEPPAPIPQAKNPQDRKTMQRLEQERAKKAREADEAVKQAKHERRLRRQAEERANAIEADAILDRIAAQCGIQKINQAKLLYREHCAGKTTEELAKMDEAAFFSGLRKTDPYLFGEVTVPATTGTTGPVPGSHAAPRPGATAAAAGAAGKVDVREMTKPEFEAYKRARGIQTASTGLG
jgi:hypothetical protein